MNYRSVVVLGNAATVMEGDEKAEALRIISENIIRGRWNEVRKPTGAEMKATSVMKLPIHEASAKIRSGAPLDDQPDYDLPIWAGILPLMTRAGEPVTDPAMRMEADIPESVRRYARTS